MMRQFSIKLILFLFFICAVDSVALYLQMERNIRDVVFSNYDNTLRPVINESTPLILRLNPSLYSFVNVNITEQTMTIKQWLSLYWYDEHLKWNPTDFGNVTEIDVQRSAVWVPDIMILEQTEISQLDNDQLIVRLRYDGYISSEIDQLVTIKCQFDVTYFPYDTQNCTMRYSSWMYDGSKIVPYPTEPADLSVYSSSNEWMLKNITSQIVRSYSDDRTYIEVWYFIKMTRMPTYYIVSFVWPSFLITCLSILGVFSPFDEAGLREEKVTMGLTSLLSMAVILQIVTDQMPRTSNGMPLLGMYIMFEICLGAAATVFSVFVMFLHSCWLNDTPLPPLLQASTCMNKRNRKTSTVSMQTDISISNRLAPYTKKPKLMVYFDENCQGAPDLHINFKDLRVNSIRLRHRWSTSTHRLDLILMSIFMAINCVVTFITLTLGNSKLNT